MAAMPWARRTAPRVVEFSRIWPAAVAQAIHVAFEASKVAKSG